jgi:hypothetical protein
MRIKYVFLVLLPFLSLAQIRGITYQATMVKPIENKSKGAATNAVPLSNSPICLRFTLYDVNNNVEYQETLNAITDFYGLVNVIIGSGEKTNLGYANDFSGINWDNTNKVLEVSVNFNGECDSFKIISSQNLESVPFANFASNAGKVTGVVSIENGGTGSGNKNFVDLTTNQSVLGEKTFGGLTSFDKDIKVRGIKFGFGSGGLPTNTIIGMDAFNKNISGEYNTAFGLDALNENLSSFNTAIGHYALVGNTTGYANTALGAQALIKNKTGRYNLAAGVEALARNTTGENNTAVGGYDNMLNNTVGNNNTSIGYASMYSNVSGSENVGLGINTLYENVLGSNNVAIGSSAGYRNTGSENVYLGNGAGYDNVSGNSNIYIGSFSGKGFTGNKNIVIGDNITNENTSGDNQLNIGNIIKGNLINGDVTIAGNIIAKNLPGNNSGDVAASKPVYQTNANNVFVTSSTSYSIISVQIVVAEAGNYLAHFSSSYENDTPGSLNMISLFVDGQIVASSERRDFFAAASESRSISTISYLTNLTIGQVVDVKCKVSNGRAKLYNRTLVLQKN